MKPTLVVRKESFPYRCEVCHQTDQFEPQTNLCLRCESIQRSPETTLPPATSQPDESNGLFKPGLWFLYSFFSLRNVYQSFMEGRQFAASLLLILSFLFPLLSVVHWGLKRWFGLTRKGSYLFGALGLTFFDMLGFIALVTQVFPTVGWESPGAIAQWTAITIGVVGFIGVTIWFWWKGLGPDVPSVKTNSPQST